MKKLLLFIKNLNYLSRYSVKDIYKRLNTCEQLVDDSFYALDHIRYEIVDDFEYVKQLKQKYKFYNAEETVNKLINSNCSICRFGDGEINLIKGGIDIVFEKQNKKLAESLRKVISSNNPNILVAVPDLFHSFCNVDFHARKVTRIFYSRNHDFLLSLLKPNVGYYCAGFTIPYINSGNSVFDFDTYYNNIKKIWDNKEIVIICGDRVFHNIEYNIYDNASSIEYILCPTTNAYQHYDEILYKAKKIDKNKIVIIMLGPTATVLAYDLANLGYRALDTGHLAKDYDAYCKNIPSNAENICKFFDAD